MWIKSLDIYPYGVYYYLCMMKERKNSLAQRLNIISGQVNGLAKMVEKDENCQKITTQFYAVKSSINKVIELYFKENLESCVKSPSLKNKKRIDFLLKEIIKNK